MADDSKKKIHAQALLRFKLAAEVESEQRARELAALKFDSGNQWPDWVKTARAGQPPGTPGAVSARPCLTINKLDQPLQQIASARQQADLAVQLHPTGASSRDLAQVYEGLIRQIQTTSRANIARDWASERAEKVGRGYYRINKRYVDDTSFDQELCVEKILNQGNVLLDPYHDQPETEWAFQWEDVPIRDFLRQFSKSKFKNYDHTDLDKLQVETSYRLAVSDDGRLTAPHEQRGSWVGGEGEGRTVRVAEYWYASYTPTKLTLVNRGGQELAVSDDDRQDGDEPVVDDDGDPIERIVQKRRVDWCKISAAEVLEETEWEGQIIPIVPVVGNEYNLNGERIWSGVIQPAMDAQRLFNYTASAIAEATAIAPKAPFIVDPQAIEGLENFWKEANTRNFPYLPVRSFDENGRPFPPPVRQQAEPPVQALSLMLQQADNYIKATTGVFDPSLGNVDPQHRSGRAILALQQQSDRGTSVYLDHLAQISMTLEGKILYEMIPHVYDRPGRIVQIINDEDETNAVMLGVPFVQDGQGQPVPAMQGSAGQPVNNARMIDLSAEHNKYAVVVDVGRAFSTRRQEGAAAMTELIQSNPTLAQLVGDLWIGNMDFPGAQQISDRLRALLPPQLLQDPKQAGLQAQQMIPQLQQALQLTQQQLQQATQIIQTKQVEQQANIQKQQIQSDTQIQVARINQQTQLGVADLKASVDQILQSAKAEAEQLRTLVDAAKEVRLTQAGHAHEAALQTQQHVHDVLLQGHQQRHEAQQATQQQDHEASQAMQQQASDQMSQPNESNESA